MKKLVIITYLFLIPQTARPLEIFICKYSYNGDYSCDLLSEKEKAPPPPQRPAILNDFSFDFEEEYEEEELETM